MFLNFIDAGIADVREWAQNKIQERRSRREWQKAEDEIKKCLSDENILYNAIVGYLKCGKTDIEAVKVFQDCLRDMGYYNWIMGYNIYDADKVIFKDSDGTEVEKKLNKK